MKERNKPMNIELRFLQKAILDRNYISFSYEHKNHKKVKALKLIEEKGTYSLVTPHQIFEFNKIKKIQILKEKY